MPLPILFLMAVVAIPWAFALGYKVGAWATKRKMRLFRAVADAAKEND